MRLTQIKEKRKGQNIHDKTMFDSLKKKFQFKFKDRTFAANILAAALEDFLGKEKETKNNNMTVLGIPRGGVIVGDIVATKLKSDFDIVIPRKLRIPHNEEAAFGAIMGDGTIYVDDRILRDLDISEDYVEREKDFQLEEIKRRSALYRNRKEEELQQAIKNKINDNTVAILVDDGAASGATVIAAARSTRKTLNPNNKLIIGLPVAPKETEELLRREADHVEVVTAPSSFFNSVGQYYQSFEPVNDEKVVEIMQKRHLYSGSYK
jgi:putative phosphoribosyl transferase